MKACRTSLQAVGAGSLTSALRSVLRSAQQAGTFLSVSPGREMRSLNFSTPAGIVVAGELDFADDTLGTGDAVAANACVTPGNTGVGAAAYRDAIAAHAPSEREDDREHGRPTAFHGQPVHPLPPGETFAGIVVPTAVWIFQFMCPPADLKSIPMVSGQSA